MSGRRNVHQEYWERVREWAELHGADGCSLATGAYLNCCLEHDLHYRTGKTLDGKLITRWEADKRFLACMQRHSWLGWWSPMAWVRYGAVRLFGSRSYKPASS